MSILKKIDVKTSKRGTNHMQTKHSEMGTINVWMKIILQLIFCGYATGLGVGPFL